MEPEHVSTSPAEVAPDQDADVIRALHATRAVVGIATRASTNALEHVTALQLRALVLLRAIGPLSAGELADRLGVSPSASTRLSTRLVRDHWLRRTVDKKDRRQVTLTLTKQGAELVDDTRHRRTAAIALVLERLDDEDRAAAVRGLELFAQAAGEPWPENSTTLELPMGDHGPNF